MEQINLHFTGDFHAITSAHNLLSALIDNHIYWGNKLDIDVNAWVFLEALTTSAPWQAQDDLPLFLKSTLRPSPGVFSLWEVRFWGAL